MKFQEIFRFEFAYQIRRLIPWLCFMALFGFAFWLMAASTPFDDDVHLNAPFNITFITVFGGAIWLFVAASIAGEAAARDVETRMHSLMYTAPVSKAEYLGGRFFAAFVLNALTLLAVPAGILLALFVSRFEASLLGPFRLDAYLTAYGIIAVPFAFVATAFQFSWATLNRRTLASYLASGFILFTSHFVLLSVLELLGRWELVRLLDLVGLGSIAANIGDSWTAYEKNTRLVGLEGALLANRLIWSAIAVGVLAFTFLRFRFAHAPERTRREFWRRRAQSALPAGIETASITRIAVPQVRQTFGLATHACQTLAVASVSFSQIAKRRAGLLIIGIFALFLVVLIPENMHIFDVPVFPRTERIVGAITAALHDLRTPLVIIPLLIAFYAGELIWRERDARVSDIADAAPVSEWVLFLGKFLGLSLIIVVWLALLAVAGMLAQLAMGYRNWEVGLYVRILLGLQLPEYLLFACLALAIHAVVNQKYLGHLATLLALGFIGFAPTFGIEHNLLIYGAGPGWTYTDMRGFGSSLAPWFWFKLYWAAWALLLAVSAKLLWGRGRTGNLRARLRMARGRFTRPTLSVTAAAAGLILSLGGFVFYNTNVLNEYRTAADIAEEAAEYERRYRQHAGILQPLLAATNLHVEIYSKQPRVDIRGTYRLVNRTREPINAIHLTSVPDVRTDDVSFDRPATLVLADKDFGYWIYVLKEPLQPDDVVTISFEVEYAPRGFRNSGAEALVIPNGTLFNNSDWLPAIGYQPQRELRDTTERRAHGLSARASFPGSLDDVAARRFLTGQELIAVEAVVGTDEDQVAVAPGILRRTWTEGGRRYFHYATDAPIRNEYAVFSANYAVHEARWNDVAIQIYHDPRHTGGLEAMVRSVQSSLALFTAEFGPYPYKHLRLVERAGGEGGMSADTTSIAYDEVFAHFDLQNPPQTLDLPFYVVAHEVSHQWWGSQLAPAVVEGLWLMSESLAVYSGMQVLEEAYGDEQVRRYLDVVRSIYAFPRTRAAVPLLRADESFLGYRKGAVVLYALSRYIGEDRVNGALRRLLEKYGTEEPPLPTSLDLYRELQAVTPDALQYLLYDLFEANTFWELETERATAMQIKDGTWQVTLDVQARKVVIDTAGVETEVPMNDWVEIGVFAADDGGGPMYRQMHRIRSGAQRMTVTVPTRPERAGIDPWHLLIDLEIGDNARNVTSKN